MASGCVLEKVRHAGGLLDLGVGYGSAGSVDTPLARGPNYL